MDRVVEATAQCILKSHTRGGYCISVDVASRSRKSNQSKKRGWTSLDYFRALVDGTERTHAF